MRGAVSVSFAGAFFALASCGGGGDSGDAESGASGTAAGTDVLADGQPALDVLGHTGVPASDGTFEERWSLQLDAPIVEAWTTPDMVYVTYDGPPLRVEAFDADDGTSRWSTSIIGSETWLSDFPPVASELGLLAPYGAEGSDTSQHLALISKDTGEVTWDIELEGPLSTFIGGAVPGVASVAFSEEADSWRFVDIDNGAVVPDEVTWTILDQQLVVTEGTTVRYPFDPFEPDAGMTAVDLGFEHGPLAQVGTVLVATDGGDLVGFVDGTERWRAAAQVGTVSGLFVVGDFIAVVGEPASGSTPPVIFARVDADRATYLGGAVPFEVRLFESVGGEPIVVGVEPELTVGGDVGELGAVLRIYDLTDDGPVAREDGVVLGGRDVFVDLVDGELIVGGACPTTEPDCHSLVAVDIEDMSELARLEFTGTGRLSFYGDDEYGVNYVEDDSALTAYA